MLNLTKAIALVSSLVPSCGYSLGIGDIKLHSALNQYLDAEISLVVSPGDKISDIKVNLAPPDKFDEAGVPWTSFLSKIKFEAISGANGTVKIKISSREALKEPVLDFLLQVTWPKGSLYREFTVLLDPPTAYNKATNPAIDNQENYNLEGGAVIPYYEPLKIQQIRGEQKIGRAGQYGPTNRNDSLWKVAEPPSRQMGVSVEQMMMAIYEENPQAFYNENVNALLTGKILKIPERNIVIKLSRKQALAEFNRQTQAWKNRSEQIPVEPGPVKKETLDNQLTLAAPTKEPDIAKNVINVPENEQLAAKNKIDKVESNSINKEIVSPVNDALQDKVAELEKQLAMMQQILALKNEQLAVLQNQISAKPSIQPMTGQIELVNPVTKQQTTQPISRHEIQTELKRESSSKINYLLLGAGILFLLGWLWWHKRKSGKQTGSHNLFASSSVNEPFEPKTLFSTSTEKDSVKKADSDIERPIFSEITFGDFQSLDTEQIDPVSEADVYLAYGRYQQAEDLLRDAIKDQPNRDECKLKLLKIFYTNKDNQAFETYANELAEAGKKDDLEFWEKVTEMGREICKDSKMFSSEEDGFSQEENTIFETLPVKSNDFEDAKNEGIDFVSSGIATKCEESSETLDSFVFETPDPKHNDELESFDIEFGLHETEIKAIDKIDASIVKKPIENDQLIDSLTNRTPSSNTKLSNDFLDRDFYFDKPESEANRDVFDLTDMDEFETKLDLAKAYIDMSDTDTAKEIICEVLEKGTADQKKIAQSLLKDLK
ncbi:MAG: hypothetical protein PHI13_13275 [Methylococcales bacterium]|nr:hypothetical protein [Methylococcales bacterium]